MKRQQKKVNKKNRKTNVRKNNKNKQVRSVTGPAVKGKVIRGKNKLRQITFEHREYFADVKLLDGTSSADNWPINPGIQEMFPWLSGLAVNFESYVFNKLSFEYVGSCSTATDGAVYMAIDYDVLDSTTVSKRDMMQYEDNARSPWWTSFKLNCTGRNLQNRKSYFVRKDAEEVPAYQLYDAGRLFLIRSGAHTGSENDLGGEIWVNYKVTLMNPQISEEISERAEGALFLKMTDSVPGIFTTITDNSLGMTPSGNEPNDASFTLKEPGSYEYCVSAGEVVGDIDVDTTTIPSLGGEYDSDLTEVFNTNNYIVEVFVRRYIWTIFTAAVASGVKLATSTLFHYLYPDGMDSQQIALFSVAKLIGNNFSNEPGTKLKKLPVMKRRAGVTYALSDGKYYKYCHEKHLIDKLQVLPDEPGYYTGIKFVEEQLVPLRPTKVGLDSSLNKTVPNCSDGEQISLPESSATAMITGDISQPDHYYVKVPFVSGSFESQPVIKLTK